jgi:hypothetical protein
VGGGGGSGWLFKCAISTLFWQNVLEVHPPMSQ